MLLNFGMLPEDYTMTQKGLHWVWDSQNESWFLYLRSGPSILSFSKTINTLLSSYLHRQWLTNTMFISGSETSYLVDRSSRDINGFCKDYPLRRHRFEEKANEGSLRCLHDWAEYIGPIERWGSCNPCFSSCFRLTRHAQKLWLRFGKPWLPQLQSRIKHGLSRICKIMLTIESLTRGHRMWNLAAIFYDNKLLTRGLGLSACWRASVWVSC